jgi:hypothetical protein
MPGRKPRAHRMSGLFDFFDALRSKGKKPQENLPALPAPKTGLPAIVPEQHGLIQRAPTKALKERLLSALDFFSVPSQGLAPAGEPPKEAPKKSSWDLRIEPEEEPEEISHELLAPEGEEEEEAEVLPGYDRSPEGWAFPDIDDMVALLRERLDIEGIFQGLLRMRTDPAYEEALAHLTSQGVPLYTPVSIIDERNFYHDFARFYGIPEQVLGAVGSPEEFVRDYLTPLGLVLTQAMDELKPEDLPGFFTVDYNSQDGKYWLFYVEPWLGRLPGI